MLQRAATLKFKTRYTTEGKGTIPETEQPAVSQQSPTLIAMLINEQLQTVLLDNVSLPTLPNNTYISPLSRATRKTH